MKKLTSLLLLALASLSGYAQDWIDVTDMYIVNPRFDNNDRTTGWEGWPDFGAANPRENAEHYETWYFDNYQTLTGLTPGKYRLTLDAFYRIGSASNDYQLYTSGEYVDHQYATLYANLSSGRVETPIVPLSSAALEESLGGGTSRVGNSRLYVPNNMEAAYYWFEAGYYDNSVEFEVGADGTVTIGIYKYNLEWSDWVCLDNWKLEYWGTLTKATGITLSETDIEMVKAQVFDLKATVQPANATYRNVTWSSSNEKVAIVNNKGQVTAVGLGTCRIIATSVDGSDVKAECKVTVSNNPATAENIIINEIMAANVDVYLDPSQNYGSWVELYNPTSKSVSLGGLYVSDDPKNLKKHKLIETYGVVAAHGYALLNFDHFEVWTPYAYRQIDDKLDCDGGTIIISDGSKIIAQQDYPEAISRTSYARTTDGGEEWGTTGNPSPGLSNQANGGFATTRLDAPIVDKDAQLFAGSLQICVNIPEGATLRYTTDGTSPTLDRGETSTTGIFNINYTTCFRFRLFKDGYLPSTVVTRTYIYNEGNYPFPIISVVTDDNNFYSEDRGVFEQGPYGRPGNGQTSKCNWNMDWDRPVSFEYLNEKGECVVSQECDLSICGGWSRAWSPRSFKLKAKKVYDFKNTFDTQFFDEKPYLKSKTLQIRNGGNDTSNRIKDGAIQEVVARSGMYVDYQSWQPVHVFINGWHYAVLNMREPNNKDYGYANYGIDTDEMDQFEMSPDSGYVQMKGTDESFLRLVELSENAEDENTYEEIGKLLDIDEYINYMAVELYTGNWDWPQNNVKGFRDQNDGKFHFVLFDLDGALSTNTPFDTFFGKETYTFDTLHGFDYSKNENVEGQHVRAKIQFVTLFKNLLKNETFRKQFIDTYCIVGGSVFKAAHVKSIITEMRDYLAQGNYVSPQNTANTLMSSFTSTYNSNLVNQLKNCTHMQLKSVTRRPATIATNVPEAKILIDGIELPYSDFDGYLFPPVTLTAVAPAGYRFAGWKNGVTSSDYVTTEEDYSIPTSGALRLTAVFEEIPADEMIAKGITPVRVNEVSAANSMYVNDHFKKDDWVELYNTTDKDIDISGMYISDNAEKPQKYQIPTDNALINTIIPAHGYKVIWCDKRENIGSAIHTSFKLASEGGDVVISTNTYADTLRYATHLGTQTFGRYPDGANDTYVMNAPTIDKSNLLSSYDTLFVAPINDPDPDAIRSYTKEGGITIAYVEGAVNVKSEDAAIRSIAVFSTSGMKMPVEPMMRQGDQFASIHVATLPRGIYIVKAVTAEGDECHIKFIVK
ncbi:MAG: CotH kinase family protein [Bacteroidaceae bacterium]|nr:CotH kinase family protein [Bacteroidaceae bacterium]